MEKGNMFIKGAKNKFPVDIDLDVKILRLCTVTNTVKGKGIVVLGWSIQECWVDKDGNLVIFANPESKVDNIILDRYGNQIYERIERSTKTGDFMRPKQTIQRFPKEK